MARCFSGQLLREARIAAGLRPEHLALSVNRSTHSIHEYELGRVQPPVNVLARLALLLDARIDDFLADEGEVDGAA